MSMMPFGFGGAPSGMYNGPMETIFPGFQSLTMPSMRKMEHELGRLISSVKEDDKSFQVLSQFHQLLFIISYSYINNALD